MIKQVFLVQVNDRFGYVDTLEQAKKLEDTFNASFSSEAITSSQNVSNIIKDALQYED